MRSSKARHNGNLSYEYCERLRNTQTRRKVWFCDCDFCVAIGGYWKRRIWHTLTFGPRHTPDTPYRGYINQGKGKARWRGIYQHIRPEE